MHIEKIKYFIDLYECRNYTETSRKNFISQAAISQYINGLEKEFGVQLFDRSVTPVEATEAGTLFYQEARILLQQYESMQEKMSSFQKEKLPPLRIAYTSTVDIKALLPFIPNFKAAYPQVDLQLHKIKIRDVTDYLTKNVCDLAVSFSSEFEGHAAIGTRSLYKGKYVALVGNTHPLYSYEQISIEQLYQYPLIMLSPDTIGTSYDLMKQRTREEGYIPQIKKTVDDIDSELFSVMTENLIGFAPDNYKLVDFNEYIRLIPLENSVHDFHIEAGFLKKNQNPTLSVFLSSLKDFKRE